MSEKYNVSKEEKIRQAEFADKVKTVLAAEFYECSPKAFIHTYGCQGNVSDSERIMGMLKEMGYEFTNDASKADLILIIPVPCANTPRTEFSETSEP